MLSPKSMVLAGLALPAVVAGLWLVQGAGRNAPTTRTYYIAAQEVEWDYAPTAGNRVTGQPFNEIEQFWMASTPEQIGRVYRKAVYREYTDATFTTQKPRSSEWEHLGILGPVVRGVVGDTIKVVFRNNASRPYTVHPHGVFYDKRSEGALYQDGTAGADKEDDGVPPGGTHTYVWPVPERAGPAEGDGSSILWMYHSHLVESRDVASGLIGPLIITGRRDALADGRPKDVDREFVVAFSEIDENLSWYFEHNIDTYASPAARSRITFDFADPFYTSNLRETLNGLSFGHVSGLTMARGERVRWYLFSTTGFEVHTPHWHGQTAIVNHMRTDAFGMLTMDMKVADMVPDNAGQWLFHCHVSFHNDGGMQALFTVTEPVAGR